MLMTKQEQSVLDARRSFRYYSRKVLEQPSSKYYHQQRIAIAQTLDENEPLQGALADYIFSHWFDLVAQPQDVLADFKSRLTAQVWQQFEACLKQQYFIRPISRLATRWSVLLTPSSDVPAHQQVINREDSLSFAHEMSLQLLQAKQTNNEELVVELENEFISHCLACMDRIAFLTVWMKLSNQDWKFTSKWYDCHDTLNRLVQKTKAD